MAALVRSYVLLFAYDLTSFLLFSSSFWLKHQPPLQETVWLCRQHSFRSLPFSSDVDCRAALQHGALAMPLVAEQRFKKKVVATMEYWIW